jgi:EcsC protein family
MARRQKGNWISRAAGKSATLAFLGAYRQVRVDPDKYLKRICQEHRLPVRSWPEMFDLGPEVINPIARRTIASASKMAGLEGLGMGFGGFMTVVPDIGVLSAITLRMLQKISLLYGFEYSSEAGNIEFLVAAATAAGLDLGRDFLKKQAAERLVPQLVDRIAVRVGSEIAEKWAGRIFPVVSAGAAATINYYFVRGWGRRAQRHFLARHESMIGRTPRTISAASRGASLSLPPRSLARLPRQPV